jgi:hypothetical protein
MRKLNPNIKKKKPEGKSGRYKDIIVANSTLLHTVKIESTPSTLRCTMTLLPAMICKELPTLQYRELPSGINTVDL